MAQLGVRKVDVKISHKHTKSEQKPPTSAVFDGAGVSTAAGLARRDAA